MDRQTKIGFILLFAIAFSVFMHQGWHKPEKAQAGLPPITSCAGCHGYSGYGFTDGSARNNPAGTFLGSHNKHVVTYSKVCSVCHVAPATDTSVDFKHRNSNIQMASPINGEAGAAYTKGTSWPQTNSPTAFTGCTNTYCHSKGTGGTSEAGEVRTVPANTSTAWAGTISACNICHGTETGAITGAPGYANLRKAPTAASSTIWLTPTNVYASDSNNATYDAARAATPALGTDYISITGFGFTVTDVPDTATITDITVAIKGSGQSATAANRQIMVRLVKAGILTGTAKTAVQLNQTTDTEIALGGNNDLWGATWTPADIRAANFGVAITDNDQTNDALNPDFRIDKVRIIVHTSDAPKKNSHTAHMASYTCSACHNTVVASGNSPITSYTQHADKTYDVAGTAITTAYAYNVAGGTCGNSCHGGIGSGLPQWGVTEIDCIVCHSVALDAGDGGPTRREVVSEFNSTWSHKRSASGAVTKYDCGVCHMEGDATTGNINATYHRNNAIDLRDPDLGTAIAGVSQFYRDTANATIETWVTNVQNNLCLKCHDAGGATSASARVPGGTAQRPFNTVPMNTYNQVVLDVNSQFATTNITFHPVRGPQNNPFCYSATMYAPWNTKAAPAAHPNQAVTNGPQISCWDCHSAAITAGGAGNVTAHGGASTLRGATVLQHNTALGSVAAFNVNMICIVCHDGTDIAYSGGAGPNGSAFGENNLGTYYPAAATASHETRMTTTNTGTCTACHGSSWLDPGRPFRAEDVHGFNRMAYYRPPFGFTWTPTTSGTNWTTPANVSASDNANAVYNNTLQNDLAVTAFGVPTSEIPDGVTVTGIAVRIEGNGSSADAAQRQIRVGLSKVAGTLVGTRKTGIQLPQTTDTTVVFGGPEDLWGATFTPAEVRAVGFGLLISDNDTTAAALNIDHVKVVVYTNRWGNTAGAVTGTNTGAAPYGFLRNAADKTSTAGAGKWATWRPRKVGATNYQDATNQGHGCSWQTAGAAAPCSRSAHVNTWVSYGPGGVY